MPAPCFRHAANVITQRTGFSVDEPLAALLVARHRGVQNVTGDDVLQARGEGEPPPVACPSRDEYEADLAAAKRKLRGGE